MEMVRVLSLSRVSPAPSQQQGEGGLVKLSYLDVTWVWLPAVQLLFLYPLELGDDDGFPAVVSRLKAALADTLTRHLPCAGMLDYQAETGHIVVDCSDAGVAFVEAEADGDGMDVRRLACDEVHDVAAFVSLVPELDARVLPAPVMSVQVTRLGACGLAVGVSMHHAVADGRAMFRFMEAWAAASSRQGSVSPPIYCRDALRYPRDDDLAREWLKIIAPNLPVVVSSSERVDLTRAMLARRTFHLGAGGIRSLKRRVDNLAAKAAAEAGAPPPKPVSTFVALAALCWTALVRSKGLGAGDDTYLVFLADLRTRLHPPLTEAYLGNCIRECVAGSDDAAEILHAARAVQAAVAEMQAAPVPGYDKALSEMARQLPLSRLVYVVGSPWLQAYQGADFGFGKPARAEVVSMNKDGEIMLLGGRRDGEVQLSVCIHPAHMPTFKACILGHMPSLSRI